MELSDWHGADAETRPVAKSHKRPAPVEAHADAEPGAESDAPADTTSDEASGTSTGDDEAAGRAASSSLLDWGDLQRSDALLAS